MAVRFVVEINHVTLREKLRRISAIVSDRVDVRKRLHSKFAVEAAAQRVKNLVLLLCSVPDVPLVHVTNRSV